MKRLGRWLVACALAVLGIALASAMLDLPAPAVSLAANVEARIDTSGVTHPVTAVLLNFRGYDTLLEIVVLTLALLGVLAVGAEETMAGKRAGGSPQAVLQSMARALAPLVVLVAAYLLWAGSRQPGGAFQASAVLAAGAVLLYLAGVVPRWHGPGMPLRAALAGGFLFFLAVAALPLWGAQLLQYPPQLAGALIMAIEGALTLSVALILAGLFVWLPDENEDLEQ